MAEGGAEVQHAALGHADQCAADARGDGEAERVGDLEVAGDEALLPARRRHDSADTDVVLKTAPMPKPATHHITNAAHRGKPAAGDRHHTADADGHEGEADGDDPRPRGPCVRRADSAAPAVQASAPPMMTSPARVARGAVDPGGGERQEGVGAEEGDVDEEAAGHRRRRRPRRPAPCPAGAGAAGPGCRWRARPR